VVSGDADILVVGGGPAGAATATWLARQGWSVLLLEKTAFPRAKPCAEYFSPGVVALLDRLGLLEAVRAADVAWPRGMRVCAGRQSWALTYDAPGGESPSPRLALSMPRARLDHLLLDHARASGVHVREQVRVLGTLTREGRVIGVRAARGSGGEERVLARLVVGADGVHSTVSRSLELPRSARWPRRLGLVAHFAGRGRLGDLGEMHVGAGAYCGVTPVGRDLLSVGLVTALDSRRPGESPERLFERRLAELPGVGRALGAARRVTPVRGVGPLAGRVRRVAGPGYLLVGDAAGMRDPFTGEGVYRALRGAAVAAEVIGRALRDGEEGGHHLAGRYRRARRAAFADKERVTWLVQLFLAVPRGFEYVVRRLGDRPRVAAGLAAVLGDYRSGDTVMTPAYAWSLLRP
jgi:menaquinone-9 beta-reductase